MILLSVHIRLCLGLKNLCTTLRGPTKGPPRMTQMFLQKSYQKCRQMKGQNHTPTTNSGSLVGVLSPHIDFLRQVSIPILSEPNNAFQGWFIHKTTDHRLEVIDGDFELVKVSARLRLN